jgi:hypothetical protein
MFAPSLLTKVFRNRGRRKATPARRSHRFRPTLESFDDRLVPSNVTTNLVNGNLTLADDGSVSFTIRQQLPGQISIIPDAGTTVYGQAGPVSIPGVTGSLAYNMGSGNDSVTFDLSRESIFIAGDLSITGSSGSKTVLTNTDGADNFLNVGGNFSEIYGNSTGVELTRLNQFQVTGNMTLDHANGGSLIFLGVDPANLGELFNGVGGNLIVDNVTANGAAASGFDVNALEETNVRGFVRANMGFADQTGGANNGIAGWTSFGSLSDQTVNVGGGVTMTNRSGFLSFGDFANDGLEVQNARVTGDVTMNLGSGVGNTALFGGGDTPNGTSARSLSITGRGAHDGATLANGSVVGNVAVSLLGNSANSIAVDQFLVGSNTSLSTAGGHNSIAIDDQAPGSTFVGQVGINMTGTGNFLSINSKHRTPDTDTTVFNSAVTARLGTGINTLHVAEIGNVDFEAPASFNVGSPASTSLVNTGNLTGRTPTVTRSGH